MGACSTYIKRNDKDIDLIFSSSLPVGILGAAGNKEAESD